MKNTKPWLLALVLILAVVVILQNTETVETRLLFATVAMPRAVLLIVTLLIGALLGMIAGNRMAARKSEGA